MPLSWNEIRDRSIAFANEWKDEYSENAEAKTFWDSFFNVFGITRRRVASFEEPVNKSDGKGGFIDLLWKGILVVEHKSRGKDLIRAFHQATNYFSGLKERDLPRYVLVSDFARFRLYDLDEGTEHEFPLKELHKNSRLFGFIAGYEIRTFGEQDPVNIAAAEKLGKLHDYLKAVGYDGHALEVFLVRLLFCLFAEDNAIFERQQFRELVELRSAEDGSDLAALLANLFQVLNTAPENRLKNLDEQIAAFAYINGKLFAESLPVAAFDKKMRETLLDCTALDWARISPAIFGALFQSIMDKRARRNLGAHYTSEENILKALQPLFLDALRAEFERVRRDKKHLIEFQNKLGRIRVLDPACGCGNFLVIAYRELRMLELDVLRALIKKTDTLSLNVAVFNIRCDVDQFYGIEIEEFPAQISQVALWMTDHQMNLRVSEEFGQYFARLPLNKAANIIHGNALQIDWRKVVKATDLNFIVGNPPFIGKKEQTSQQKADVLATFGRLKGSGILDYVSCWYQKTLELMEENIALRAALVSTNSITQGEQVGVLWGHLLARGVFINFAHRTFQWSSEARGKAAVHCVIIGFARENDTHKRLFDYDAPDSDPHELIVNRLNPYLVDAPTVLLKNRRQPICSVSVINYGSFALDDGFYTLSESDCDAILAESPNAQKYLRPFVGGRELLYGEQRWCLWLQDAPPEDILLPAILRRVEAVRNWRQKSDRATTKALASTPALFAEIRQPHETYLALPTLSSEKRAYIPMKFLPAKVVASNQVYVLPNATLYHFGVLTSLMHMAWVRGVCGRLKSDYRYSTGIVYNNFLWPVAVSDKQKQRIEDAAQAVLDSRAKYPDSPLANLYNPLTMPPTLVKSHHQLDVAVDAAYSKRKFFGDADRVAFLFELYQQLLTPLTAMKQSRKIDRLTSNSAISTVG